MAGLLEESGSVDVDMDAQADWPPRGKHEPDDKHVSLVRSSGPIYNLKLAAHWGYVDGDVCAFRVAFETRLAASIGSVTVKMGNGHRWETSPRPVVLKGNGEPGEFASMNDDVEGDQAGEGPN
jgi:hypothetical protein